MKVIDLLNKIANGEEVPTLIKINNNIFKYRYDVKDYTDTTQYFFGEYIFQEDTKKELNKEVEIIEEDKKLKKLNIKNEKNCKNNWKWKIYGEEHSYTISTPQKIIADKINEIIDYLEENKND